ncbi:MAG TPA: hypothetical protein DDY37_03850 [Legionella sp.]|nr:hypothetical protein [Legionella sp.]
MANHLPFIPVTYTHEGKIEGLLCTEAIIAAFNIAQLMLHASQKEERWVIERDATLREFVCSLDNPLPFDGRATLPAGMYKHCIDTPTHWEDHGQLTVLSIPEPDLKCKADWREFKTSLKEVAMENTARFIESPKGSSQHHDVNHYFRFIPGAESPVSPPQMRIRSASTSSISPIQLNEEGSPRSRLRSSPIYCTFFTNNQSVESSLFLMPESAPVDHHEKLVP